MPRKFALNLAAATLSLFVLVAVLAAVLAPDRIGLNPAADPSATPEADPLANKGWELELLYGEQTTYWYLQFKNDGTFFGSGCSDYMGEYVIEGGRLIMTFTAIPQPCLDDPAVATAYQNALSGRRMIVVTEARLLLIDEEGRTVATFTLYDEFPDISLPVPSATPPMPPTQATVTGRPLPFGIVIGHSGAYVYEDGTPALGSVCADGVTENAVIDAVAAQLMMQLEGQGHTAILFDEFDARIQGFTGLALIELHTGSCEETRSGYNIGYTSSTNFEVEDQNIKLVQCFSDHYQAATGLYLNGATPMEEAAFDNLGIVDPQTPAITFEIGALGADRDLIMDFERIGTALADGLIACTDALDTADQPTATADPADLGTHAREIAFMSDRDGNMEIYTMTLADQQVTRLTFDEATDQNPAWSPDGSSIAFASDRNGSMQLYLMAADGSDVRQITSDPALPTSAFTWSPDGQRIAFLAWQGDVASIYMLTLADQSVKLIAEDVMAALPSWSPDGQRVMFADRSTAQISEYVEPPGASRPILAMAQAGFEFRRAMWMPDGEHIVFEAFIEDDESVEPVHIMIATVEGENQIIGLNNPQGTPILIGPSPDGQSVAFWQLGSGGIFLTIASADATFEQTAHKVADSDVYGAAWTHDSKGIVFSAGQMQQFGLYYFDVVGFGITPLLVDGAYNAMPSVRP